MTLSIIIPVFNEEKTVEKLLQKIHILNLDPVGKEIIVINDGSSDNTSQIIKQFIKNKKQFIFIDSKINEGKGSALKKGFAKAKGSYIIIQDADLEYDPTFIPSLLKPLLEKKADVVYGTRLKRLPNFKRDEKTIRFALHYFGNRFLSFLQSVLYLTYLTDIETCYKLFPTKLVKENKLNSSGFEFEVEITSLILQNNLNIVEIPIKTTPRDNKHGKKLRTVHDGLIALYSIFKYRFFA